MVHNRESQWIRIKEGNIRGVIDSRLSPALTPRLFEDLDRQTMMHGGRVVKDSRVRWAAILPLKGGNALYIKQFRIVGGWQRLKYTVRPSRAMKEWFVSRFLIGQGVLTPRPLGAMEKRNYWILKECFFLAEALEGARDLLDFCRHRFQDSGQIELKNQIVKLLAETVCRIHDTGLFHKDLHAGNFLVTNHGSLSLYLVDLHQARKQLRVSHAKRLWNIAQIFNSLDFMLNHEAKRLFLLTYGQGRPSIGRNQGRCLKRVEGMVQKMVKRRQKSRAKRCLKESTLFTIGWRAGLRIFRRRELREDDLLAILEAHEEKVRSRREDLLKYSPKTIVSIVGGTGVNSRRVCVKEYRYGTVLDRMTNAFRQAKGKTSWVAGNVLFSRGICPVKPLAYAERRKRNLLREAFYVTESLVDDTEMDRYLIRKFERDSREDLRRFIRQFAGWVGSLHRAGIYHSDLKTCNILVRENLDGWGFSLIDLEDVVQGTKIGVGKILRNLIQINCSIPKSFSYGDRIRFLKDYTRVNPFSINERLFIRKILEQSRKRGVVYVSPEGDVIEDFE